MIRVRVLGECTIQTPIRAVTPAIPSLFAILLRLAADPLRQFQRGELVDLLFAHPSSDRAAYHSLRQLVYLARKNGAPIVSIGGALSLESPAPIFDLDDSLGSYLNATPFPSGRFHVLPGYQPAITARFAEWLDLFRNRSEAQIRAALLDSLELQRKRANWQRVEQVARECLASDAYNETATLALAEALAQSGSKERAVATLQAYKAEVQSLDEGLTLPAALLRKRIERVSPTLISSAPTLSLRGRGDDVAALREQGRRARTGRVECTLVRGEQGSGKTRLVDEFVAQLSLEENNSIAVIRNVIADRHRPLSLFAEVLPELRTMPGAAGCDPALIPFLDRLAGSNDHGMDDTPRPGQATFVSHGITRAVVDLFEALARERPCLLVVDDSQAIDSQSIDLLQALLKAPTQRLHILIVCNAREKRPELLRLSTLTRVLAPLSEEDSSALVMEYVTGSREQLNNVQLMWCTSVASGNPAFLQLAASRSLYDPEGDCIPADILSALDHQLAHLTPSARVVLDAMAVLGNDSSSYLLSKLLDVNTFDLVVALSELEQGGFISYATERIRVRSGLLHDRVLELMPKSVHSLLHARCGEVIEDYGQTTESSWRLASHWRSCGQHARARASLKVAWRQSIKLGRPENAEALIREQLANTVALRDKVELYNDLIEVTQASGRGRATIQAIDERAEIVTAIGIQDERALAIAFDRLEAELIDYADPAQPEGALLIFMRSSQLDTSRRIRSAQRLIISADSTANKALARSVYNELSLFTIRQPLEQMNSDHARLIYHSVFGDPSVGLELAHKLINSAPAHPIQWAQMQGLLNATLALQLVGDSHEAISHLQACYPIAVAGGVQSTSIMVASRLASFALDDGDIAAAFKWSDLASAQADTSSDARLPSDYLSVSADLALIRGDLRSARAFVATMGNCMPIYEALRYRMTLLAYELRVGAHGEQIADSDLLEKLLQWHNLAKSFGRYDDDMEALWSVLRSRGEHSLATRLLAEYLFTYRREKRAPRYMLRTRTADDIAWRTYDISRYLPSEL